MPKADDVERVERSRADEWADVHGHGDEVGAGAPVAEQVWLDRFQLRPEWGLIMQEDHHCARRQNNELYGTRERTCENEVCGVSEEFHVFELCGLLVEGNVDVGAEVASDVGREGDGMSSTTCFGISEMKRRGCVRGLWGKWVMHDVVTAKR